jgi:hypothetical protein
MPRYFLKWFHRRGDAKHQRAAPVFVTVEIDGAPKYPPELAADPLV